LLSFDKWDDEVKYGYEYNSEEQRYFKTLSEADMCDTLDVATKADSKKWSDDVYKIRKVYSTGIKTNKSTCSLSTWIVNAVY